MDFEVRQDQVPAPQVSYGSCLTLDKPTAPLCLSSPTCKTGIVMVATLTAAGLHPVGVRDPLF